MRLASIIKLIAPVVCVACVAACDQPPLFKSEESGKPEASAKRSEAPGPAVPGTHTDRMVRTEPRSPRAEPVPAKKKKKDSEVGGLSEAPFRIEIFTRAGSKYCAELISFLDQNKIPFVNYDIEEDDEAYYVYLDNEGIGVPMVKIGDDIILGFEPAKILQSYRALRPKTEELSGYRF